MGLHDLALVALTILVLVTGVVLAFARNLRVLSSARLSASTDPLTGLGNRAKLLEDLEDDLAAARPNSPLVVALLDLDGFKRYNDAYGHPAGDRLLARLGRALRTAVVPWGSAYRLGGDEFCVVVRDRSPGLETIVSTAAAALSERGDGFTVRPSCGMVALPQEAGTPETALELAERRLYVEKNGRRDSRGNKDAREVLDQALREREPALDDDLHGVAALARATGRRLGLPSDELDVLIRGAELHNLGKVAVPDAILSKPGPLTEEEQAFFRQHTLVGDRILRASSAMAPVARLVRSTREHFDGSGYPDGLAGEEIPLGARVIAVCDAYHAMTSDRPYRPAASASDACAELRRSAGSQFDPAVVDAFCAAVESDGSGLSATSSRPRRGALLASAALAVLALAAPSSSLAASASISGPQLNVTAGGGEANNLTLSQDGVDVRVAETGTGVTLTAGAGCSPAGLNQVLCPLAGLTSIFGDAGNMNDRVTVTAPLPAVLLGNVGDDVLYGGPLGDVLNGGSDDDWLIGGGGSDDLIGGSGGDFASWAGRAAAVTVDVDDNADDGEVGENDNARSDVETLIGGDAADTLTGNTADNGLDGGPGADTLNGGAGDDYALYWMRTAPVTVDFDGLADDGEAGENDIVGSDVESAIGGAGDDTLTGGPGVNFLWGWSGNDTLDGGGGADLLWGGSGTDTVTYASRSAAVTASLDNVANDGEAGEGDSVYDVENLTGGSGADSLTGNALANTLIGGPGSDSLIGHDGDDAFEIRDEEEDAAACGNGADSVVGDWTDLIDADCDSVDRSAQPSQSEDPPSGSDSKAKSLVVRSHSVRLDSDGNVSLQVRCPLTLIGGCKGTITLELIGRARGVHAALAAAKPMNSRVRMSRRSRPRRAQIGRARFSIAAGRTVRVKVRLSRNGRRRVLRKRSLRCKVRIASRDESGKRTVTTGTITLKAPKTLKGLAR